MVVERHVCDTVPAEFWAIIEGAAQDPVRFREMLEAMNQQEIIQFYWTYEALANDLRNSRQFSHVHPNLSEDGMAELANWVVAQGCAYYGKILDRPELVPPKKDDPGLLSEAVDEYEQRFDEDIPPNDREWDDEWKQNGQSTPWT